MDGAREFDDLVRDVAACARCERMTHTRALSRVNGPLDARVLFVAEAVGRRGGAITGIPLTRDESARRFEAFLGIAGLRRDDVFVTNAVLCHPHDARGLNRAPSPGEVARCRRFLERTIDAVASPVVVALGRTALEAVRAIAPHDAQLASHSGRAVRWRGTILVPMYHPSRQSTLQRTQLAQDEDWQRLGRIVRAVPPSHRLLPASRVS